MRLGDYQVDVRTAGNDFEATVSGAITVDDFHALGHLFCSKKNLPPRRRLFDLRDTNVLDREEVLMALGTFAPALDEPCSMVFVAHDPIFDIAVNMLRQLRPLDRFAVFDDVHDARQWLDAD